MKTLLLAMLVLAAASVCGAQGLEAWGLKGDPGIAARHGLVLVYVAPMDGFENYITAALEKKKVPVNVTVDQDKADFIITGTSEETKPGWARWLVTGDAHTDDAASIRMIEVKSGRVVYAYAVNKKFTWHGQQTAAEAFAKHLEKWIDDGLQ
jgi:hypothetical protein